MNEKILGSADNLSEFMALMGDCEDGVIVLTQVIDLTDASIYLTPGKILRGKTDQCGLKFDMGERDATPLTLLWNTTLENLTITAKIKKVKKDRGYGVVLIDDELIVLKNLRINLTVEDDNFDFNEEKAFAALYLRHRVESDGMLSINAKGLMASPIRGNFSSRAILKIKKGGKLCINLNESICPGICKCMVEIEDGTFIYENLSKNAPYEEFSSAYVFLIGDCTTYGQTNSRFMLSMDNEKEKRFRMEVFHKKNIKIKFPWYIWLLSKLKF